MSRYLKHIKFLFSATNQHGVHSPFVYNFVTKCLYKKQSYGQTKSISVLLKSIAYFKPTSIWIADANVESIVQKKFNLKNSQEQQYNLVYLNQPSVQDLIALKKHNDTLVLVNNIYQNKRANQAWEAIKKLSFVTVTIDMFYCGAVFFRKEQEKEHFKIRI